MKSQEFKFNLVDEEGNETKPNLSCGQNGLQVIAALRSNNTLPNSNPSIQSIIARPIVMPRATTIARAPSANHNHRRLIRAVQRQRQHHHNPLQQHNLDVLPQPNMTLSTSLPSIQKSIKSRRLPSQNNHRRGAHRTGHRRQHSKILVSPIAPHQPQLGGGQAATQKIRASEYKKLRQVVPSLRRQRDVGKVEVVAEAARYIDHLHKTLIERFILCGIPDSLKDILGTDDARELNSQHIMNLVTQMALKQHQQQHASSSLSSTSISSSRHDNNNSTGATTTTTATSSYPEAAATRLPAARQTSAAPTSRQQQSGAAAITITTNTTNSGTGSNDSASKSRWATAKLDTLLL